MVAGRMTNRLASQAARTPRILWLELTSKCPFDCIFCSRQIRGRSTPALVRLPLARREPTDPRKFIAGHRIANPVATILSVAMMLEWLDSPATRQGAGLIRRTQELGGALGTRAMGDAVGLIRQL
jgi:hypothetical protein